MDCGASAGAASWVGRLLVMVDVMMLAIKDAVNRRYIKGLERRRERLLQHREEDIDSQKQKGRPK
jgi:hypothetical protein